MNKEIFENAVKEGKLIAAAQQNINELLDLKICPSWVMQSLEELSNNNHWEELNDRFHSNLAFGTGGMRGRTIGKIITNSEKGLCKDGETPNFAAVEATPQ